MVSIVLVLSVERVNQAAKFYNRKEFFGVVGTIFDSLLMSFCGDENQIIGSDKIFEKFNFNVISLDK